MLVPDIDETSWNNIVRQLDAPHLISNVDVPLIRLLVEYIIFRNILFECLLVPVPLLVELVPDSEYQFEEEY